MANFRDWRLMPFTDYAVGLVKSCPCCGARGGVYDNGLTEQVFVQCSSNACLLSTQVHDDFDTAIARWNMRLDDGRANDERACLLIRNELRQTEALIDEFTLAGNYALIKSHEADRFLLNKLLRLIAGKDE